MYRSALIAVVLLLVVPGTGHGVLASQATSLQPAPEVVNGRIAVVGWHAVGYPGAFEIFTVDPVDGSRLRLTRGAEQAMAAGMEIVNRAPAWSPDGTQIAYVSNQTGQFEVYVMEAFGAKPRRITSGLGSRIWPESLSWSPDGTRLLATGFKAGEWCCDEGWSEIWQIEVSGGTLRRLHQCDFRCTGGAAWSPDGSQIVFGGLVRVEPTASASMVHVMNADGSNLQLLGRGVHPSWSPDGSQIVYVTVDGKLTVMNRDGSEATSILNLDTYALDAPLGLAPCWAPDGTQIAFQGTDRDRAFELFVNLWVVNADGTDPTAVARMASPMALVDAPTMAWQPTRPVFAPVGLVNPTTGMWHLARPDHSVASFYYGDPGDVPMIGDWDGDGIDTPGLFRTSDAYAYLSNANRSQAADIRFFFGNPSDVPLAGDWDGDGDDTLSIYRPDEQRFYIINELGQDEGGLGPADFSFAFGNPGDKPVVGDWDGDGIDEVGLHRESTGFFYWRNTLTTGIADGEIFFGDPGDRFVAGDWGIVDGSDTPAVFRPSTTTMFFRHTLTQGAADAQFVFGETPWLPVAGTFGLG